MGESRLESLDSPFILTSWSRETGQCRIAPSRGWEQLLLQDAESGRHLGRLPRPDQSGISMAESTSMLGWEWIEQPGYPAELGLTLSKGEA